MYIFSRVAQVARGARERERERERGREKEILLNIYIFLMYTPRYKFSNFEYLIVFTSAPGVLPEQSDRY